jgi:hypothetical protein
VSQPLVAGDARDVELDHDVGDRSAFDDHPAHQLGAVVNGQAGMSVEQRDPRAIGEASAPTPSLGGLLVRSILCAVNNADGHYT